LAVLLAVVLLVLTACESGSTPLPTVTPPVEIDATPTQNGGMNMEPTATQAGMVIGPTATSGGMAMERTPTGGMPRFEIKSDLQYIELMVPHHRLAVDMAKLAQQKATRSELKGLANDIILTQQDEINRMNLWWVELRAPEGTGGVATTPDPHDVGGMMDMPGMDIDLEALANSPTFDIDFANAMIPHHQTAIDMSRGALPHLTHEALRGMAQDIIDTQQLEIDRMNRWQEEWK
jgi:uncharacterized protein (DUF305 family)